MSEPTDGQIAAFKEAWHRADDEGRQGDRVREGLRAVLGDLRRERDALHWSLTQLGYSLGNWCEEAKHHENCLCVDPEEGDWSQRCADLNEFRPALLLVDANHGDQLAAFLPEPEPLRLYGDLLDRARAKFGDEREETA